MRALICSITAAAFWLHIMLGCCAHHSHSSDSAVGACRAATGATDRAQKPIARQHAHGHSHRTGHSHVGGHTHSHDHSSPKSDGPQSEPPSHGHSQPGHSHDDNHETHCNFLLSGKTTIVQDTLLTALQSATLSIFDVATLDADQAAVASAAASWLHEAAGHPRLPVRAHLAKQVMLI